MPLQIRRGTDTQRAGISFAEGEIVYTIDTKKVYVGDGSTLGGIPIDTSLSFPSQAGNQGKFLTTNGNTVSWATVEGGGGITDIVNDTSPQLGGDLDLNDNNITGTGGISINGTVKAKNIETDHILLEDNIITASDASNALTIDSSGILAPALTILQSDVPGLYVKGINISPLMGGPAIVLNSVKGSYDFPENIGSNESIGGIGFVGLHNDTDTAFSIIESRIGTLGDNVTTFTRSKVAIKLIAIEQPNGVGDVTFEFNFNGEFTTPAIRVNDGTVSNPSIGFSTDGATDTGFYHPGDGIICTAVNSQEKIRIDSGGMRVEGFMKVGGFATGSLPNPPEAGMIVLDTDTGQFKGYNGSGWVVLG